MAITLRNKAAEEMIRQIGRQRGLGPSAVIVQAVEAFAKAPVAAVPPEQVERRLKVFDAIVARARAELTDEDRAAMRKEAEDMYDEFGLPK